ncbi:hypothetical protein RI129_000927 [Pyrocoelia pectoralis]|uniref:SWIM-type domain-containing protein n=1 Tax=Pyrocoelia pectoralis TaxID=417401 RepID=A0AAN7ZWJ6_9COLE
MSSIINYFKDEEKLICKGENAVDSGHVNNIIFDAAIHIIRGSVHASMRAREYKVEILFASDWSIDHATCECPRGQLLCHHMAAVLLFSHYNVSITDSSCSWNVKNQPKKTDIQTVDQLFPSKEHRSTPRDLTEEEVERFKTKLQVFDGAVGFSWLLSNESNEQMKDLLLDIEEVLCSTEYLKSDDKTTILQQKLFVCADAISKVAKATVGQISNENWLICRKHRLTASNFGPILTACRRNRFPPSLFKRLTGIYIANFS